MRRIIANWLYMLAARIAPRKSKPYMSYADLDASVLAGTRSSLGVYRKANDTNDDWPDVIDDAT